MPSDIEQLIDDYEAEQAALPPHQRDGYAERIYEQADDERKRLKEEA